MSTRDKLSDLIEDAEAVSPESDENLSAPLR